MYEKRIKVFVILVITVLGIWLVRLSQMQLLSRSFYQERIEQLKLQQNQSRQLRTLRGRILDRNSKILAEEQPQFQLHIDYTLSCFLDRRIQKAKLLLGGKRGTPEATITKEILTKLEHLNEIIDKCTHFGQTHKEIEEKIREINNRTWELRSFLAWIRNGADDKILQKYNNINTIPMSVGIEDFQQKFPDENQRLLLVINVDDITDLKKSWPLVQLRTDDDILTAQLEFMDVEGVQIKAQPKRYYPYHKTAAQIIGWVGPPQEPDKRLFAEDRLSSYLDDEVAGREDGIEFVCEATLRGKRGEVTHNIDRQLINKTETQPGEDLQITIDIELQQAIENHISNCEYNPHCKAPAAVAILDVATSDILAMVSTPTFDLNQARFSYASLVNDSNKPLINRVINKQYPPGSVAKPVILIAGLEAGKINPHDTISCPAQAAPQGWPNCWIYNKYSWLGHDDQGPNNAHNAIKGSCNIYFSRLADRVDPVILQKWLFKFGYGQQLLRLPTGSAENNTPGRNFRQAQGQVSSSEPRNTITAVDRDILLQKNDHTLTEHLGDLAKAERRFFGIGQGNLRATPLQVANAMATIARDGLYKRPRLLLKSDDESASISLDISRETLDVVRRGMSAVVNDVGGTAYKAFENTQFKQHDVTVYGKTGSTEAPINAWFAGFAEDSNGRSIAIAVVVEGGQHGASDAAPLARAVIELSIAAGYLGRK